MADDITHQQLLDAIQGNTVKLDELETKFDGLEAKVGGLTTTVDGLTTTVDGLTTTVDGLTNKVGSVHNMMEGIGETVATIADNMATKDELKALEVKLEVGMSDLDNKLGAKIDSSEVRLTRQIRSSHSVNVKHHLETRKDLGQINSKLTRLTEGLAKAAGAH